MSVASFNRLVQMDAAELSWRAQAAARALAQRASYAVRPPRWRREDLGTTLAAVPELADVHRALRAKEWDAAHERLQRYFATRPSRFVLRPADRVVYADAIAARDPNAPADAATRADRLIAGDHDLLGYRGLRFGGEWHYDPVSGRRAPRSFWADVPFLDPQHGDHKVIWEVNRHQHWLALGRAFWLTGDEKYRDAFVKELRGWLDANPPLAGINWASMLELAFRAISWIWALHFFARTGGARDSDPWTVDLLLGLDRQLTHVEQNLSYYFSPNTHLLGEALTLYVAGRALPELAASDRRASLGRHILVSEASRQIAPDGGHCERSTHYHRYTLDFYLLALVVARITRDPIAAAFERIVDRLASAARLLADDHGRAPHFGDDDGGMLLPIAGRAADDWRDSLAIASALTGREDLLIGTPAEEVLWMTGHPAVTRELRGSSRTTAASSHGSHVQSGALADTGYYVSRSGGGEHVVFDGGAHGYKSGAHAHADALSMTLSLRGVPLLIDPGTASYTSDPALRDRFRTTAAHNTVLLDDVPQSVARGPFHWSRTADAVTHRWRSAGAFDYFDGSHDGYAPVTHRRRVLVMHGDLVIVADSIDGAGVHKAAAHWHLGNAWSAAARSRSVSLTGAGQRVGLHIPQGRIETFVGDANAGLGWHSPAYGRVEPTTTIRITHEGHAPFSIVSVFDLNPIDPVEEVEWLPLWAEAGTVAQSAAIKIVRHESADYVSFVEPARSAENSTWRVAELETDARMLFCRVGRKGEVTRLALVDASVVRASGRRALGLALGRVVPAILIDEFSIRNYTPCAASPGL